MPLATETLKVTLLQNRAIKDDEDNVIDDSSLNSLDENKQRDTEGK